MLSDDIDYDWSFEDYPSKKNGLKVFSTFSCGGGSTMGYKLAGYEVIGANDIDPEMQRVYEANHHPRHYLLAPIKDLLKQDMPEELYGIDVLDGSPPCSVFSMAGSRETAWQKDKVFREGQAKQILDDLFFDFIDLVEKLKPKIIIAENVKGMLSGSAKWYTREVHRQMLSLGYTGQIFLFNGATMGLPQKRQRVFFIYAQNELNLPKLEIQFSEIPICFKDIKHSTENFKYLSEETTQYWEWCKKNRIADFGKYAELTMGKRKMFNHRIIFPFNVCDTVAANCQLTHYSEPRYLTTDEVIQISSFPKDYNFLNIKPNYLMGMSVPPLMMAKISNEVYEQWGRHLIASE